MRSDYDSFLQDENRVEPENKFLFEQMRDYEEYREYVKKLSNSSIKDEENRIDINRIYSDASEEKIIDAFPHEFPWMVRIGLDKKDICTNYVAGTLINEHYVLTAAQNVSHWIYQDIYVGVGIHNLRSFKHHREGDMIKVNRILVNKECAKKGKAEITHDIALLELERPATIGRRTNTIPITLPSSKRRYNIMHSGWVAGWGTASVNKVSKPNTTLRKVAVQVLDRDFCNKHLENHNFPPDSLLGIREIKGVEFCANIGSPIMIKNENREFELAGLVTLGRICYDLDSACQYGYYINIPNVVDWINENSKNPIL